MRFNNPYWGAKTKIQLLQWWVIVHSVLYYVMDTSIVSDKVFDSNARQLVKYQAKYTDDAKRTEYWYIFKSFDATTGFHIYSKLKREHKDKALRISNQLRWLHDNKK